MSICGGGFFFTKRQAIIHRPEQKPATTKEQRDPSWNLTGIQSSIFPSWGAVISALMNTNTETGINRQVRKLEKITLDPKSKIHDKLFPIYSKELKISVCSCT